MSTPVELIRGHERTLVSAILNKDLVTLDHVLAPEFVYTASEIGRRTRQEWIDGVATYRLDLFEIVDMAIEVFSDVALVNARIRQHANIHGLPRIGYFLITDVWVKRDEEWQVVSRTSVADREPERSFPG